MNSNSLYWILDSLKKLAEAKLEKAKEYPIGSVERSDLMIQYVTYLNAVAIVEKEIHD